MIIGGKISQGRKRRKKDAYKFLKGLAKYLGNIPALCISHTEAFRLTDEFAMINSILIARMLISTGTSYEV